MTALLPLRSLLVCVVLLASGQAVALPARSLAVLEVVPAPSVQQAGKPLDVELLGLLSDTLRESAIQATAGQDVSIMTRDAMQQVADSMPACQGGECTLNMGQTLQVDAVLGSELAMLDGQFLFTMQILEVKTGRLLDLRRVGSANRRELLGLAGKQGAALVRQGLGLRQFGAGFDLRVPVVDTSRADRNGLTWFNPAVEDAFTKAKNVEHSRTASPEDKMEAWCHLAALEANNRYMEAARPACSSWRQYVLNIQGLRRGMPRDYDAVATMLHLENVPDADKHKALLDFVDVYKPLSSEPLVVEALRVEQTWNTGSKEPLRTQHGLEEARVQAERDARKERRAAKERKVGLINAVRWAAVGAPLVLGAVASVVLVVLGAVTAAGSYAVWQTSYGVDKDPVRFNGLNAAFDVGLGLLGAPLLCLPLAGGGALAAFLVGLLFAPDPVNMAQDAG